MQNALRLKQKIPSSTFCIIYLPSRPWSISIILLYFPSSTVNPSSKVFKGMELCEFSEHRDQREICMQTRFYVTFLLLLFISLRRNFSEVTTTGMPVVHVERCSASVACGPTEGRPRMVTGLYARPDTRVCVVLMNYFGIYFRLLEWCLWKYMKCNQIIEWMSFFANGNVWK